MGCFVLVNVNDVICVSVAYPLRMGCASLAVWQDLDRGEYLMLFNIIGNVIRVILKGYTCVTFWRKRCAKRCTGYI